MYMEKIQTEMHELVSQLKQEEQRVKRRKELRLREQ